MERYSIKRIAYAIGGQMLIAHMQRNYIVTTKNYIVMEREIMYDIQIER